MDYNIKQNFNLEPSTIKNNYFKCLIFLFVLLTVGENSFAKPYIARSVDSEQTTLYKEWSPLSGVALNDSSLVYFARLNNIEGLYLFDTDTEETKLLKNTGQIYDVEDLVGEPWVYRHHAAKEGLALVSALGKLYATDGTPEGTNFVKDFGSYYCCSYGFHQSVISGIFLIDDVFYITTWFDETYLNPTGQAYSELWRSDGTAAGTIKISSASTRILNVFSASINNQSNILFLVSDTGGFRTEDEIEGESLWKVNPNNGVSLFHQFQPNLKHHFGNPVQNQKGSFLCVQNITREYPREFIDSDLWRIAHDGSVTSIEKGCHVNTLSINEGRVYYLNDQGLKSTDGITGNAQTELAISFLEKNRSGLDFCDLSDSIYYAIEGTGIIEINAGSIKTIKVPQTSERSLIQACAKTTMIIDSEKGYRDHYIFDSFSEEVSALRNFSELSSYRQKRNIIENNSGELFSFGFLSPDFRSSPYKSQLIKINHIPPIEPQLMLLLEGEQPN